VPQYCRQLRFTMPTTRPVHIRWAYGTGLPSSSDSYVQTHANRWGHASSFLACIKSVQRRYQVAANKKCCGETLPRKRYSLLSFQTRADLASSGKFIQGRMIPNLADGMSSRLYLAPEARPPIYCVASYQGWESIHTYCMQAHATVSTMLNFYVKKYCFEWTV